MALPVLLRRQWLVWAPLLLVPLLNWPATRLPFERDEGEYALAATIASHGGLPYRDTFLQKPPGIIVAYRAMIGVTDGSPHAIHIMLLLVYTLTAAGIGAIAWKLSGKRAAAAIAISLYAFSLSVPLYKASAANTEAFMVPAIVAAVLALLAAKKSASLFWVLALGAALGIAGMMKQAAAPHVIWLLPALVYVAPTPRDRWRWPLAAFLSAGIVVGLFALPYIAGGAIRETFDAVVRHNFEYAGATLERAFWKSAHVRSLDVTSFDVALWLAGLIGVIVIALRRQWWPMIVLGGWAATAWVGVSAGAVYRGHYFIQMLAPVVIFAAFTVVAAPRRIRIAAIPVAIVFWLISGGLQWTKTTTELADQRYHTTRFANAVLIGEWLRTQPDRSLYILGSEPEIYYYVDVPPVTRYVIQNPLFGGFATSHARQQEAWAAVAHAAPRWIITELPLEVIPFFKGSDPWLRANVEKLLTTEYEPRLAAVERRVELMPAYSVPDSARQLTVWERVSR